MSAVLSVILEGKQAGTLTRRPGGRLHFAYDPKYRRPSATPLSLSMPIELEDHTDAVVRPWIAGLLPDNELVLDRWGRDFHVPVSPFALLGTQIGEDCAGAVQFASPERTEHLLAREGTVEWLDDADVAGRLRALRNDSTAWLGRASTGKFSLAGAHAKTALLYDGVRWGLPLGSAATSHILKPAVTGLDDHDLNEHLCLEAARKAGLIAARTWIQTFEDEGAIVVERYDRRPTPEGAGPTRIHQEDLCQALSVHPSRKYENEGGPGAAKVIDLMRGTMNVRDANRAVAGFVDALIWNWLIAGTDAHAKNYSLLLSGTQIRLAPLYDVASALPYPDMHERRLRLAMKLGRDYYVFPHHDPWPGAAKAWGVERDPLRERVIELAARVPDAFSDAVAAASEALPSSELPARLVDLVTDRVRRCLGILGARTAGAPK